MNIKSMIVTVLFAVAPSLSQAGVIYEWRPANDATPWGVSLQLEFDQATVDSGAFSLDYYQTPGPDITPRDGLLSLRYTTRDNPSFPMNYTAASGGFEHGTGFIAMQIQFDPAGFLTGSIAAADGFQNFEILSSGALFTFIAANNDGGMEGAGCSGAEPCIGAAGFLEAQQDAVAVAEPVSIGLLVLGGAGMMCVRRRRQPI